MRSGTSLLGVPQPVTDPFRAALMRVFSSSSFYPDFYGINFSLGLYPCIKLEGVRQDGGLFGWVITIPQMN